MILYLDTSALVKLYVNEIHSDQTRQLTLQVQHLVCHDIGYIETRAALASAERGRRLSRDEYAQAVKQFPNYHST